MTTVEVGSAYFALLPSVKGLQGAIGRELSGINGAAAGQSIGKSMGGGIVGSLKSIVGPAIAAIGIGKAFSFAKEAVGSFSELEDSSAAASVVFGKNMGSIIALSKGADKQLGLSSQQVINAANTFGTYGKAAGLQGPKLAEFSTGLTKLAGDMASFKGTTPQQAIEAVGAALRGETEPIRSYGVLLDDASARQEALKLGLISTTKDALTPQQKVLAFQSLIYKQTADAQGDFARTSNSTANVAKTLSAAQENLSAKLGSFLAPAFTNVKLKAIDAIGGVSSFLDRISAAKAVAASGGTNLSIMTALFGTDSNIAAPLAAAMGSVKSFFAGIKDGQDAVSSSGFNGFLERMGATIHDVFGNIGNIVRSLNLGEIFQQVGAVIGPLIPQVLQLWQSFSPLGLVFQSLAPVLPAIAQAVGQLAASLGAALGSSLTTLLPVLQQVSTILVDSLGTIFAAVAPVIISLLGQLGGFFGQIAPIVGQLVGVVAQLVGQLVGSLAPIITDLVTSIMPPIVDIFGNVLSAIAPLVQMIAGLLIPIIQALLPVVTTVFQAVANIIKSVMQIIQGVIQVVTGIIKGDWGQVWQGIQNIFSGIWNTIVAVVQGAINIVGSVISNGLNLVWGFVSSVLGNIGKFFADTWNNVTKGVGDFIGDVVRFFTELPGKIMSAVAGFGTLLLDVGRNLVQGLIDGVGGMINSAVDAVKNVGGAMLDGVKGFLGIKSPSTRFRKEVGQQVGAGTILGVLDMKSKVAAAVRTLIPVPDTQALALAGATRSGFDTFGSGGSSSGDTWKITVQGDMFGNARELVEETYKEKKRQVAVNDLEGIGAGV